MPPPLGAGGIMFLGCPCVRASVRDSVRYSVRHKMLNFFWSSFIRKPMRYGLHNRGTGSPGQRSPGSKVKGQKVKVKGQGSSVGARFTDMPPPYSLYGV